MAYAIEATGIGRRTWASLLAVGLAVLLAACVFAPGKFGSALDVRRDGTFRFTYTGELYLVPLLKSEQETRFTAQPCTDPESGQTRTCSPEELAQQQSDWAAKREQDRQSAAAMAGMLGGLDAGDPRAPAEFVAKLARQKGWKRVEYRGGGKFDVEFVAAGRLDHDFAFPTVEGFPMANALVQLSLRNDGSLRIDAPGFAATGGMNGGIGGLLAPGSGASTSGAAGEAVSEAGDAARGDVPAMDGVFTITTDAEIRANNTDGGPIASPEGRRMVWPINARTATAPTALLQLVR